MDPLRHVGPSPSGPGGLAGHGRQVPRIARASGTDGAGFDDRAAVVLARL
jgi:hypothetical protein